MRLSAVVSETPAPPAPVSPVLAPGAKDRTPSGLALDNLSRRHDVVLGGDAIVVHRAAG